jgi:hypothetical protein
MSQVPPGAAAGASIRRGLRREIYLPYCHLRPGANGKRRQAAESGSPRVAATIINGMRAQFIGRVLGSGLRVAGRDGGRAADGQRGVSLSTPTGCKRGSSGANGGASCQTGQRQRCARRGRLSAPLPAGGRHPVAGSNGCFLSFAGHRLYAKSVAHEGQLGARAGSWHVSSDCRGGGGVSLSWGQLVLAGAAQVGRPPESLVQTRGRSGLRVRCQAARSSARVPKA